MRGAVFLWLVFYVALLMIGVLLVVVSAMLAGINELGKRIRQKAESTGYELVRSEKSPFPRR